ncbi:MAG TPA: biopolymer transporter ExbD [Planctomycetota bacterium]|jgi:biopolymer transport protein ExbD|nr:biopolymer transporter ExbD [Planctomycetota bacterium]
MTTKTSQAAEHVNPNLIPMIDIMFLLLLFFMLGADMGHRELEDVRLPKAEQAKQENPTASDNRLTINAHHRDEVRCSTYEGRRVCRVDAHWKIAFRGKDCTEPAALASALEKSTPPEAGLLSDRRVMIRADAGAPYGLAQRAMNVCASKGIYKIEVGAAKPQTR